jgi:hypothetical protein
MREGELHNILDSMRTFFEQNPDSTSYGYPHAAPPINVFRCTCPTSPHITPIPGLSSTEAYLSDNMVRRLAEEMHLDESFVHMKVRELMQGRAACRRAESGPVQSRPERA